MARLQATAALFLSSLPHKLAIEGFLQSPGSRLYLVYAAGVPEKLKNGELLKYKDYDDCPFLE